MNKLFASRYYQIVMVIIILMALLVIRLFSLAIIQNQEWATLASESALRHINTSAPRGEILDRYGRVLAGNVQTFSIKFSAGDLSDEEINDVALRLIEIMESNGDAYYDNLPILVGNGTYSYTYQNEINEWLQSQGMPVDYTAEQAFQKLRDDLGIDSSFSKYDAQSEMQNVYKVFPPISVKNMKYSRDLDKESFLGKFGLDMDLTAAEAFAALREKLKIGADVSDENARKIMIVRNEVASMGYSQYMPATLAKGVSDSTIIKIEEMSNELPGAEVASESRRDYPNGNSASHIIGYLGRITESDKAYYVGEKNYNANDLVGQDGIESAYESILKGTDGEKQVQVNAMGELVQVISQKEPKKGKDVYLTIDLELQKTVEAALEQALTQIQVGGQFKSAYGNYNFGTAYPHANVGAAVAIEVKTGDVLAMASYPDYDPNLFATGITNQDWNSLQSVNPRDSLAQAPLYNIAARTAVQPGSIFKMVTATAALESGLNPDKKLRDGGAVYVGNRPYACLSWHRGGGNHGPIDLAKALEVSCNYYFFDISTGRDWSKGGSSLGYTKPIDIGTIMSYAQQYGLGLPTGIEIRETVAPVFTAERKMESQKSALRYALRSEAETYFGPKIFSNEEALSKNIDEIVSWMNENPSRGEVIKRVETLTDVKEDQITAVADLCKYDYFNYAQWTRGDEFNISIGQGENAYTPLQMANYIATIGNGGVRNTVSLIDSIEGEGRIEKAPGVKLDIKDDQYLEDIIQGMKQVVSGSNGSLRSTFSNFPVPVAGKTGTAEKDGRIPPISEVEYIQKYLRSINGKLTWDQVEAEMVRLMAQEPDQYTTRDAAVTKAVINLSPDIPQKTIRARIAANKPEYENFAWVVTMAPADDPEIAVAVLLFQGGTSLYAAPVAREVIGAYLQIGKEYDKYSLNTTIQ